MSHWYRYSVLIALVLAALLFSAAPATAQTGKISGKIVDAQSREALPGVNVVIEGTPLGAATDSDGDYFIINVPPGRYNLQATIIGYAAQTKTEVQVQLDRTTALDFQMGTQELRGEEVTISAEREIVQMDVSGSTTYMEAEEFTTTPISQVADYLQIQEGVQFETSAQGQWLSIRGGGQDETDFLVDGTSTMNAITNVAYMGVSKTAIKEVSIQTGGFNAEYGRVRSGLVNVVTRDGSREQYTLSLDGKYSFPHLKHFGRNLYDRKNPVYQLRIGQGNFQPGDFNGASFIAQGGSTDMGTRGEVTIDPVSTIYRGYAYSTQTGLYTDAITKDADGVSVPYSQAEIDKFGMETVYSYPDELGWSGFKYFSDATMGGVPTDNEYPADMLAKWMIEHQGLEYGNDADYDMDVTITGPLPGESMNNKLGELFAKSTFLLSYRTQTSRLVFPTARRAYRDKNLQAKITMTISPQTKLRLTGLYGEAYGASDMGPVFGEDGIDTGNFFANDGTSGNIATVSGIQGGGRISGDFGRSFTDYFNEGANLATASYLFQTGAKLTHTVNARTYIELEYRYLQQVDNRNPIWPHDPNTDRFWIFNIDGLINERGEPRTFVTDQAEDIFVGGVAQRFDPIVSDLWNQNRNTLEFVPDANRNARDRILSTGGVGTWEYSRDLVSQWFDDEYTTSNARKGPNRLDMVRGVDASGDPVAWVNAESLPGDWDFDHRLNQSSLPSLGTAANGGLVFGQTLPGMTLVDGLPYEGGWNNYTVKADQLSEYDLQGNGRQLLRGRNRVHGGKMTLVSQVTKHNQFKAGLDFQFWQVENAFVHVNGSAFNGNRTPQPGVPGQGRFDVRGNPNARNWQQYYENPVDLSAYLQDKIEVQGLIANIGLRMDFMDPTTSTIDFSDPYRSEFKRTEASLAENGPSRYRGTTEKIKARPNIRFSPRIGLSFPVTETSKVYFNYGWFYQRPTMAQLYEYRHNTAADVAVTRVANPNLDWPRTIQMEMGYEQNIKGWFLLHAAGYFKDSDDLINGFRWEDRGAEERLASFVNSNYTDVRGLEFRLDKNYGLFRARFNYNYLLRTRGQIGGTAANEDRLIQKALDASAALSLREVIMEPAPFFRGTFGFFTPTNWGPGAGDHVHPFDNIVVNLIYRWQDSGRRVQVPNTIRPDQRIWVDVVDRTNTDLRAEKRVRMGRRMNLGFVLQVFNLFDQKYLVGPNGNQALGNASLLYEGAIRYDDGPGRTSTIPGNDQWGEFKPAHLSETLPWHIDQLMFNDKRDVYYGVSFSWQ